ncbi:PTS fructose transporter subunit IIABC [Mycoplasma procyoni]|uniref:PTS fructose transporter subunit IIABC n=1 Tax=Mycoplasma procyoni TaxID=568784 RepID=UPI00197B6377|nr:fructose-specific PTS transporter subunit EIIC [Mycoplasma procyoni]MBN3534782.1 PTS sugar transporter subunit IIA [Mycoplasma procyoni]
MQIKSLFKNRDTIYLDKTFESKDEVLRFFASELVAKDYGVDQNQIYNLFVERENQGSTGIGDFIAMPHMASDTIKEGTLLFARVKDLDWNSLDGQGVKYIFGIAFSNSQRSNAHLQVMAKLSKILIKPEFTKGLDEVENEYEFVALIDKFEAELDKKETTNNQETYDVVAVTACPTGIAHTYIAESKLIEAAQKMGIKIKVETQGSEGVKNALSEQEIKNAKGVILAVDREIERGRFTQHENVLDISTKKAIHNAQEQIQSVLDLKGSKIKAAAKSESNDDAAMSFDGFGKKLYRSTMTGISHMLPFIVFGGIALALGFILDLIIGGIKGENLAPGSAFFKSFGFNEYFASIPFWIGKVALAFAVPVLAGYITFALVGRQGLLPGFVVGGIASGSLDSSTYNFLLSPITKSGVANPESFLGTGSGFIGGILGAFFAAAMVIVFSKYVFGKMPKTMQGAKNILFVPVLGTLTIAIIFWLVNIPLIFANLGLVLFLQLLEKQIYLVWLLGLVVGLMMAADLGGPINKAAYVFGTLTIASGQSTISMAAVMAAGMVPPLGISLSMLINKNLWSKEDRDAGKWSNIIFGLSFISEGAIPYTSKKPKVLIPANMVGGAVAGITSALLGVNIVAPHGGIFVAFLAKSSHFSSIQMQIGFGILFWILAIVAGAFASMLTILLMSKYGHKINFKKKTKKA